MALTTKRIIALPSQTDPQEGDYLAIDNAQSGTKKIPVGRIGVEVDDTLTEQGKAADAKAVGDALGEIRSQVEATDDAIDEIRSQIEVTGTASGAIATFTDGAAMPTKSVVVNIEPKQSGTGTPSPSNIRPISGWESVNVNVTGKNLLNANQGAGAVNGTVWTNNNGVLTVTGTVNSNTYRVVGNLQTVNGVRYTITGCPSGGASGKYRITVGGYGYEYGSGYSFTGDGAVHAVSCDVYTGQSLPLTFKPMIRLASDTDPTYEPYNGTTTTTSLGRTVYGGTLDVVSGELTVTWVAVEPPASWWDYDSGTGRWSAGLSPTPKPTGNNRSAEVIAEAYETNTSVQQGGIGCFRYSTGLYVYNNSSTTPPTGKFCYPLATPQTYTLTGQEINTLLGENNVWADSGDVEVVYIRDLNIAINNLLNSNGTRSLGMMAMSAPTENTTDEQSDEQTDEPAEDDMR